MSDSKHFENFSIWRPEHYTQKNEQQRFMTTAQLLPPEIHTMLDVGCGNGAFMAFLETQNRPVKFFGLERSRAAIHSALCQTPIYCGSVENLPFADQSFSLVSAMEVIEHLPYPIYQQSLRELERVAQKYILISVPYRDLRMPTQCPYCGCQFNPYYHVRSFDEHNLETIFQDFHRVHWTTVNTDDFILGTVIRRVYSILSQKRPFPTFALCPQCGFSGRDNQSKIKISSITTDPLKKWRPRRKRPVWIVSLYERTDF